MKIIEYSKEYLEDCKDLLVELEEYILTLDKDKLDHLHPDYRDKMFLSDLDEVINNDGKVYLAIENNKAIGLIMGNIIKYDDNDYLDYTCPKAGEIIELIVSSKARGNNIGTKLMEKMEDYFKSVGCKWIHVDVFSYNIRGLNFYKRNGYHTRMDQMVKKVD